MPFPASSGISFAVAIAIFALDWILRRWEEPRRRPAERRHPARSPAFARPEAPGPRTTERPRPAVPPPGDWVSAFEASRPPNEEPSAFLAALLATAKTKCGLSAAALWTEGGADSEAPSSGAPVPAVAELDLREPTFGGMTPLATLFRPWSDALRAGEVACIPDTASEPDLCGRVRLHAANLLLLPFPCSDGGLGTVALAWNEPCRIGPEELPASRRLAEQIGAAVDRRRQRAAVRRLHAQGRVLVRVAAALRHAGDLDMALRTLLETLREGLGHENAAILLLDDEARQLFVASQVGYGEAVGTLRLELDGPSVTATAARERRTVVVPDVREWPGYVAGDAVIRSEIALPLVLDGELLGILDLESADSDAFEGASRDVLEAAADEAALVLAHARLLSGLRQRAEQLQAADRLARAITGSIAPHVILESVVAEVRRTLPDDAVLILRHEPSSRAWVPAVAARGSLPASLPPLTSDSEAGRQAIASPDGSFLPDTSADASPLSRWCRGAGWHAAYWIPVLLDGDPVGLFLAGTRDERGFARDRRATLETLAPHIAAAMRNAQLYEQLELSYHHLSEALEHNLRNEQLRILGEMTSGLAHKFNNVLGVVIGRVQTALSRTTDAALERDLRIVERAAQEGAITIRQLQQFTGMRGERTSRPVDLAEIARRVVERAVRSWRPEDPRAAEGYRLELDDRTGAWVTGIREELEEVVQHLVDNAIEAMPSGGHLRVRVERRQEDWTLEVTDTGSGMAEETKNRIFHPFVTTKGPRNLGLGLSIAYAIVTRHGGSIEVESEAEHGTTFRITLPAAEAPVAPVLETDRTSLRAARVLVVDDEPAVAEVLGEMLVAGGYEAVVIGSPSEAIERLALERFDVVLSDLGMPGLTGWDLALHCRHLHPGLPVVLITGWGLEVDDQRIAESGIFEVIPKPFEMQAVLDVVARAVTGESRRAA